MAEREMMSARVHSRVLKWIKDKQMGGRFSVGWVIEHMAKMCDAEHFADFEPGERDKTEEKHD